MAALTCTQILLAIGMLISGSINTLSKKAQNDCSSKGLKDEHGNEVHKFDHPWFQTGLMFIGETMCLIGLFFQRRRERKKLQLSFMESINDEGDAGPEQQLISQQPRVFQWIFAFPTVCDLFGTTLGGKKQKVVVVEKWRLLRGDPIIYLLNVQFSISTLLNIRWVVNMYTALNIQCNILHSLGVLFDCYKVYFKEIKLTTFLLVYLFIYLFILNFNYFFILLYQYRLIMSPQVVGMEGFFGIIFMSAIVLPVLYYIPGDQNHHSYENSLDALVMIKNDTKLLIMSLLYICSISFYNFFGLAVTKSLTAVHRTLIDALRTIVVWLVDLFIYYVFHEGFGEAWDKRYGIFQVDGFLFLLLGTALYNQLLIIPPLMPKPDPPQQVHFVNIHCLF
ncbi:unnamed protein product [Porites evermanni]|uniref:Solute carrier family 35 member F6 n=1 Tax=Porites evermanni TaxID=104178 RepID=A0ABN8PKV7_9CNID|nr:unnamed protein product [Porites evermanni]